MIGNMWPQHPADVIFLFMTPYERDECNRDAVRNGYLRVAAQHPGIVIDVPADGVDVTTDFLLERGLLAELH